MELRQLQYLRHIARVSGFRRAADELDMSQATLSEQIKLLEHELGVRLFERGGSFEADDPTTLIGLAAEGIAVGITGHNIARATPDRVAAVPIDGVRLRYSLALAWSERGPHTRAMSTFVDFASVWLTEWGMRTQAQTLLSAQAIA
jgi:DNA-binding transcriptional LysR family regulator